MNHSFYNSPFKKLSFMFFFDKKEEILPHKRHYIGRKGYTQVREGISRFGFVKYKTKRIHCTFSAFRTIMMPRC